MWTDGRTDMTKVIVAFRNFAKAPKKTKNKQFSTGQHESRPTLVFLEEHNIYLHDELYQVFFLNNFTYRINGILQRRNFSINVAAHPFTLSQDTFIIKTQMAFPQVKCVFPSLYLINKRTSLNFSDTRFSVCTERVSLSTENPYLALSSCKNKSLNVGTA